MWELTIAKRLSKHLWDDHVWGSLVQMSSGGIPLEVIFKNNGMLVLYQSRDALGHVTEEDLT